MNCGLLGRNVQNRSKLVKTLKPALFSNGVGVSKSKFKLCERSASVLSSDLTSKRLFLTEEDHQNGFKITGLFTKRLYSEDSGPPANRLPPLMDFPRLVWPSLFKSFRNFILATFIIKPYLDRDFTLHDFVAGSKKAVEVVSHKLSSGDLKSLEGLVTNDIIPTLQKTVSLMSLSQREQLAVDVDDIYFSFPYQVGIIFNDDETETNQKRIVEITMVYHSLKGLSAMRSRGEEPPLNMGMMPEFQQRISICNYRFVREYTKGIDSDWSINLLNHFKPIDEEGS